MVRVIVIGGGVNGIGSALAVLQRLPQCKVTVISKEFTPDTTGDGAAGLWGPYLTAGTSEERLLQWCQGTWDLFWNWWTSDQEWGVSVVSGNIVSDQNLPDNPWKKIPLSYASMTQEECKIFGLKYCSGFRYTSLVAESSKFLPKMMREIQDRGGRLKRQQVESLDEIAADADLIINCSGLGSRDLVPDVNVYPCRGQVMRVRAPWLHNFFVDFSEDSFHHIVPNTNTAVLGGTHQDGDWRKEVDANDSETIWRNCTETLPALKHCEIVKEWVGLRPARSGGIRIEADEIKVDNRKVPVVHNYGHGGCGVSTFWGCSLEAASIASDLIHRFYGLSSRL